MKMNGTGIWDESEESACCKLVAVSETGCSWTFSFSFESNFVFSINVFMRKSSSYLVPRFLPVTYFYGQGEGNCNVLD